MLTMLAIWRNIFATNIQCMYIGMHVLRKRLKTKQNVDCLPVFDAHHVGSMCSCGKEF